ncbi:MAG: thermonuclease family protein [bacterium]|nr:thermonuclease family protein [bacterium]
MNPKRYIFFFLFLLLLLSPSVFSFPLSPVFRVVDGDTIVVNYQGQKEKVRLIGVDTPETVDPRRPVQYFGKEASNFTKRMLTGKQVRLEFDQNKRDKYGRLLAYIHLSLAQAKDAPDCMVKSGPAEFDFDASLISCGYGHAYTRFPFARMDKYRDLERQARFSNRGLWAGGNSYEKLFDKAGEKGISAKQEGYFVASRNSDKFHRPDCKWAMKISDRNLIKFKTREEAIKAGLKPCGVCRP